jgi:hypothetical protein
MVPLKYWQSTQDKDTHRFPVVAHVDGVRLCLWTAASNMLTVHPPDDMWVQRATVELYWWKTEELREKPVPVPLCPSQISHGLTWVWTKRFLTKLSAKKDCWVSKAQQIPSKTGNRPVNRILTLKGPPLQTGSNLTALFVGGATKKQKQRHTSYVGVGLWLN